MRVCVKCNQEREDTDFYTYPSGRTINTCKYCQKIIQKAYDITRAKKRSEEYVVFLLNQLVISEY